MTTDSARVRDWLLRLADEVSRIRHAPDQLRADKLAALVDLYHRLSALRLLAQGDAFLSGAPEPTRKP